MRAAHKSEDMQVWWSRRCWQHGSYDNGNR